MIVFYVGYCYNRHNEQYFIARDCMATILNVCALARTTLKRPQDAGVDPWRFLNPLHVAAYCGSARAPSRPTARSSRSGWVCAGRGGWERRKPLDRVL